MKNLWYYTSQPRHISIIFINVGQNSSISSYITGRTCLPNSWSTGRFQSVMFHNKCLYTNQYHRRYLPSISGSFLLSTNVSFSYSSEYYSFTPEIDVVPRFSILPSNAIRYCETVFVRLWTRLGHLELLKKKIFGRLSGRSLRNTMDFRDWTLHFHF
jgi:hypothetical protein